jgi:hypothetical protein
MSNSLTNNVILNTIINISGIIIDHKTIIKIKLLKSAVIILEL